MKALLKVKNVYELGMNGVMMNILTAIHRAQRDSVAVGVSVKYE